MWYYISGEIIGSEAELLPINSEYTNKAERRD